VTSKGSIDLGGAVPNPDSIAGRAATLWPSVSSSTGEGLDAAWVPVPGTCDIATQTAELDPLLELPGQLHLQFPAETLIP
jgi:hypothetical protein